MRSSLKKSWTKLSIVLFAMFMVTVSALAQSKTVTGQVVDNLGEPVIGANIQVKGTSEGTMTDANGNFSLKVADNATLRVSFIGYTTQDVKVGNKSKLTISLEEDSQTLDDVVVVGYGVQRKSDVTGAVMRVDSKKLQAKPVNNAFEALQGKAAGVDITSSERPGTLGSVRIRGNRSLNASNDPLYVVDGVPLQSGGIEALNPRDIESIDVLKDASSTAIYGSRGANGVILITTKRGKEGSVSVNYSGTVTFEGIVDKSPAMSAADYITWRRWAYYNSAPDKYTPGDQPTQAQDENFFAASGDPAAYNNVMKGWQGGTWDASKVTDTDWTDIVKRTGVTHEHTLSVNGGTEKVQAAASFGYLDNKGTQKGQEYSRFTLSASADVKAKPWFKMGGSINLSYANQDYGYSRTGQSSNSGPVDIYSAAKAIPRFGVPYDENGDIVINPCGSTTNVYTVVDEWTKSTDNRKTFRALGNFYAQLDFGKMWSPLEGLTYKISFGPDFRYYRNGIFIDSSSAVKMGSANYASNNSDSRLSWTLDNQINYTKKIQDHNFTVTLLHSASSYRLESAKMSEKNVLVPTFLWNNMGLIDITDAAKYGASMGTGLTENKMASYMARINYSFKDRYLLTVSGRYDGSSVLAKGNKWAFFPSAALGWRMDQESWLKDVEWIDQLKLRLGVGATGNSSVSPYGTLGVISAYYLPTSNGNEQIFVTNEPYYTSGSNKMPNPDLGWEKTTQWNYGIDFSVLDGRIGGTIDIYHSKTTDLLMTRSIPSLTGYPSIMMNVGATKNFGTEITLNLVPVKTKDFTWNSDFNFAYQKDEIVELANGKNDDINNAWFIGESISVLFGYDNAGLWQESDKAEMEKFNANGHKFTVGSVRPVDQDGNYKIDADDRVILGTRNPSVTMGWSNTFNWKGLELSIELNSRMGYMVSTGGEGQFGMYNQREIDYWTPSNTGAEWQKPVYSTAGGDSYSSLLGNKKASFIKIRNLSLGYTFNAKTCKAMGIGSLKVYAQGKNLGNLYSSVDFMDLDTGTTYYNRGFTLGLQIGF